MTVNNVLFPVSVAGDGRKRDEVVCTDSMLSPSLPLLDFCTVYSTVKNKLVIRQRDFLHQLSASTYKNWISAQDHAQEARDKTKLSYNRTTGLDTSQNCVRSKHPCEGNGACSLDRRMNTNGYERGAMTGSSTTTTSDSVPWAPVLTQSRPLRALEVGAAHPAAAALPAAPPLPPDRLPHGLHAPPPAPPPAAPPEQPLFRQPLSPSSRLLLHEQYPAEAISSSGSVFVPPALYPPLPPGSYYPPPTGFPFVSSAAPSLNLAGTYHPPQIGPYAELLARMRHSVPLPSASASRQDMHLPAPSLGAIRSSPGLRHPSFSSHTASRYHRDDRSRSPDDRDMTQRHASPSSSSSPFRHPMMPAPHRTQSHARGESSLGGGGALYQRSLAARAGPSGLTSAHALGRVPTHSHSGFAASDALDHHERLYRGAGGEGASSSAAHKRPRLSEGSLSPPTFPQTYSTRHRDSIHSVTSSLTTPTLSTSLAAGVSAQQQQQQQQQSSSRGGGAADVTSATSSTSSSAVAASAQPHYPPHFMKGSIIQLANGDLKRIEELRTEDFVGSADISPDLKIDSSQVVHVEERDERGTVILGFSVGQHKLRVNNDFFYYC